MAERRAHAVPNLRCGAGSGKFCLAGGGAYRDRHTNVDETA